MDEIKGILNICRKAGYLLIGGDNIKIYKHKIYLVIVDTSAGKSLEREMTLVAESRNINLNKIDDLANLIGIESCKAVAIKNKALADKITELVKGE